MIEIEKTSPDGLVTEIWSFCLIGHNLVLDEYRKIVRKTRRHKGSTTEHYDRFSRDSSLDEALVPWSPQLAAEALARFMATIRVGRWKSDFGR